MIQPATSVVSHLRSSKDSCNEKGTQMVARNGMVKTRARFAADVGASSSPQGLFAHWCSFELTFE